MIFYYQNLKINYNVAGECKMENNPILFLHGWEGSLLSFDYFFNNLSKYNKCINLDFPPFGKSSMLQTPFTVKDYCNLIISLLKELDVKQVDIVAHSFGGRVALELASMGLVGKFVLTGCAGLKNKSFKKIIKVLVYKIQKKLSTFKLYPKSKLEKKGNNDYKKLNPIMKKTFISVVNYDQTYLLKKINIPTLLVWGENDKETPLYFTKIFKKYIKDCEVIKFEGCSHFAYLERPKIFLNILLSYFNCFK